MTLMQLPRITRLRGRCCRRLLGGSGWMKRRVKRCTARSPVDGRWNSVFSKSVVKLTGPDPIWNQAPLVVVVAITITFFASAIWPGDPSRQKPRRR